MMKRIDLPANERHHPDRPDPTSVLYLLISSFPLTFQRSQQKVCRSAGTRKRPRATRLLREDWNRDEEVHDDGHGRCKSRIQFPHNLHRCSSLFRYRKGCPSLPATAKTTQVATTLRLSSCMRLKGNYRTPCSMEGTYVKNRNRVRTDF